MAKSELIQVFDSQGEAYKWAFQIFLDDSGWIIGSNDVATIIDGWSHGQSAKGCSWQRDRTSTRGELERVIRNDCH